MDEKMNVLQEFAAAVSAADEEKGERMLAFCEGAAWALNMARPDPDDEEKAS